VVRTFVLELMASTSWRESKTEKLFSSFSRRLRRSRISSVVSATMLVVG
jgi:hypothetical protein